MNEDQRIDVCANCLHCVADENNEQVCAINYDTHARKCHAFAPKQGRECRPRTLYRVDIQQRQADRSFNGL